MKAQMRFQKILSYISLVIAALTFVFAVIFLTGSLSEVTYYLLVTSGKVTDAAHVQNFVDKSQAYVVTMVTLSIVFILIAVLLFVTSSHSRRKYYITNYIAIGLFVLFALAIVVYMFIMVSDCMNLFLNDISWADVPNNSAYNSHPIDSGDIWTFIVGYALAVIVIIDAILVVLSTVWKVALMKGEKELLDAGAARNAAEEVA